MRAPTPPPSFDAEDLELSLNFARQVVSRRLSAAAIFFLESMTPMNFVASQGLLFLSPMVKLVLDVRNLDRVQALLERRESIPYFVDLIEFLEFRGADEVDRDLVQN